MSRVTWLLQICSPTRGISWDMPGYNCNYTPRVRSTSRRPYWWPIGSCEVSSSSKAKASPIFGRLGGKAATFVLPKVLGSCLPSPLRGHVIFVHPKSLWSIASVGPCITETLAIARPNLIDPKGCVPNSSSLADRTKCLSRIDNYSRSFCSWGLLCHGSPTLCWN